MKEIRSVSVQNTVTIIEVKATKSYQLVETQAPATCVTTTGEDSTMSYTDSFRELTKICEIENRMFNSKKKTRYSTFRNKT